MSKKDPEVLVHPTMMRYYILKRSEVAKAIKDAIDADVVLGVERVTSDTITDAVWNVIYK